MTTINVVSGDSGDVRTLSLAGLSLTGATAAEGHVKTGTGTAVTIPATLDIPAGTVALNFGPWLVTAGILAITRTADYDLEVQVTYPSGAVTWPSGSPDRVRVRPQKA